MIDLNELQHVSPKGEGYFCMVKLYSDVNSGNKYALKELKREHYPKEEYRYRLKREIKLLEELKDCANVVQLVNYGEDEDNKKLWYLMPYADHNLFDYIRRNNAILAKETRFDIAKQVINAIRYAHGKGILHRDISPNNVLVFFEDDKPNIKVSDFGLGKNTESLSYFTKSNVSSYGQILYVSPEQREKLSDATVRSDIYSLGKLIYFIFTGKDPDNLKPFELSSLVTIAVEDNPEDRFSNMDEFEAYFNGLKDLQLNQTLSIEYVTFNDVYDSDKDIALPQLHQILTRGNYLGHVYEDYISPVSVYLLDGDNLYNYYKYIGNGIREFVQTYSDRLNECYNTTGWSFDSMNTFGQVLKKIILIVNDDETRLICFKQLWYLAFDADRWAVQKFVKELFSVNYISKNIETQLAEYIISSRSKVDMSFFSSSKLPIVVKVAIVKSIELSKKADEERAKNYNDNYDDLFSQN